MVTIKVAKVMPVFPDVHAVTLEHRPAGRTGNIKHLGPFDTSAPEDLPDALPGDSVLFGKSYHRNQVNGIGGMVCFHSQEQT